MCLQLQKIVKYLQLHTANDRSKLVRERLQDLSDRAKIRGERLLEEQGGEQSKQFITTNHEIHIVIREILEKIGQGQEGFYEEEYWIDRMFTNDFYIPSSKLCLEINGVKAFYPYTRKLNNWTQFKTQML